MNSIHPSVIPEPNSQGASSSLGGLSTVSLGPTRYGWALAGWAVAWAVMVWLDAVHVDLASLTLVLVLATSLVALCLPVGMALLSGTVAVLAFNWCFVPPRGTLRIEGHQHVLLLMTAWAVGGVVAVVMGRLRAMALKEQRQSDRAEQLRHLGDLLRDADDPLAVEPALRQALTDLVQAPVATLILRADCPPLNTLSACRVGGEPSPEALEGLWLCLRESSALGPGTGRWAELSIGLVPLRGRQACSGAAMLSWAATPSDDQPALLRHAQALCDQMGGALERAQTLRAAALVREEAQAQQLRNTLLAALSHDYRTPLASIMGAAWSLREQTERLSVAQRQGLAARIVDDANELSRMSDNLLQLARLGASGEGGVAKGSARLAVRLDWESAEEIVGTSLRRARVHDPSRRLRARVAPDVPLLRCDAVLLGQLLDNLIDNALKYSPESAPIEILVRRMPDERVMIAVRDRGPGIKPAERETVFELFRRGGNGSSAESMASPLPPRRGAGVGLAVCRAIAQAHGGELLLRARAHGGASFECFLPWVPPPQSAAEDAGGDQLPRPDSPEMMQ